MEQIREKFPQSRFLLWTNCTILPEDERIKLFELVYCTDYQGVGMKRLHECYKTAGWFGYKGGENIILDDRFEEPPQEKHYGRCLRPLVEFIIDNFGVVHFCCYDWSSAIKVATFGKSHWRIYLKEGNLL